MQLLLQSYIKNFAICLDLSYHIVMFKLTKNLINEFIKEANSSSFEGAYCTIANIIDNAMENIMQRNPLIYDYDIVIANEAFEPTQIASSNLEIFLLIDAIQLELNFAKKRKHSLKNSSLSFLKNFISNFKLIKQKNSNKKLNKKEKKIISEKNYDIDSLFHDLQIQLCKELYETTIVGISNNCITVDGKDDFGVLIKLYPIFMNEDKYKLYNIKTGKSLLIEFKNRFENFSKKNIDTNGEFVSQIKILNNVYFNIFGEMPNQILIESLLYNIPNEIYINSSFSATIAIINYLKNINIHNFNSICDTKTNLFNEQLNNCKFEIAYRFINLIEIESAINPFIK